MGPTEQSERLAGLDVLRGFALYGVFLANSFVSSRPIAEGFTPPPDGSPWWEDFGWLVFDGLLATKFISLFSLLFGIGLILQLQRAEIRGMPFTGLYLRRLGLLAMMGIIHGCLLYEGDVLFVYSIIGMLLFCFRKCSAGTLLGIAMVPLVISIVLSCVWVITGLDNWSAEPEPWEVFADEVRREGGLSDVLFVRRWEFLGWLLVSSINPFNWKVVMLFFLGAAIMKRGWVLPKYFKLHRQIAVFGIAGGGILELAFAAFSLFDPYPPTAARLVLAITDQISSLLLSAGYAGAILMLVHSGKLRRIQCGLAAVGRTALSNYILQSVAMNIAFLPFLFGLYGELSRIECLALASLFFCLQVVISTYWLRRYSHGPLEGMWRRGTYRTPPSNLR